ncbi:hypothetical protein J7K50_03520 [bacterium]|nr:hypothetical protein [bacterium]
MGIVLVALILLMGFLLYRKLLPAILALPVFAVLIAFAASIPGLAASFPADGFSAIGKSLSPILEIVIGQGMTMLAGAIMAVILGSILAAHIRENGVAEQIVRFAAEFGGDSPFVLSLILTLVTALLFTTLGGLGAVIMVATLTLPVMRSVGVSGKVAAVSFLLALSLGGTLNPVNWQVYKDILGLEADTIIRFAAAMFGIFAVVTILYLSWKLLRSALARVITIAATVATIIIIIALIRTGILSAIWPILGMILLAAMVITLLVCWIGAIIAFLANLLGKPSKLSADGNTTLDDSRKLKPQAFAYAAILIPLVHILADSLARSLIPAYEEYGFTMPFLAALALGIFYSFLASYRRTGENADMMMKSFFEGFKDGAPAILLMIGIGMLLKATMLPATVSAVQPLLEAVIPTSPIPFIVVFTVLAPLALYRGPLNLWGMGSGLVGIMLGTAALSAPHIMGAFFSVGMMQGVCDPTNTHNVWVANHEGVEVIDLTKESIVWVWAAVLVGLVIAATTMLW